MTAKKKAPPKKKAVKKHASKKKAPARKKAASRSKQSGHAPKSRKTPVKRGPAKAKAPAVKKRVRNKKPLPKYHINHQSWDKEAAIRALCEKIVTSSQGLALICGGDKDLPSLASVMNWFNEEARAGGGPLLEQYARAKETQADYLADEMLEIADNQVSEPLCIDGVPVVVNGELIKVTTPAGVNHARLRVDTRKFIASKLKPRVYGDKLELSGNPERPLSGMTEEQLIARQKQLEDKLAENGTD